MSEPVTPHAPAFPAGEADRCVLCGLCLPHCPTYRLAADENESPRGRITLLRAVASGTLPASDTLAGHLSRCLACRACERVCPSGVRYGQILHAGRAVLAARRGLTWRMRAALGLASSRSWLSALMGLLRIYQRSGVQRLMRASGALTAIGLGKLDMLLPQIPAPAHWRELYPAKGARRGRVALFIGCIARHVDVATLAAGIRLLTRLGYEVRVPPGQVCCGALHREAGDHAGAQRLHARNRAAFASGDIETIVTLASGCGAALAEPPDGAAMTPPVQDLLAFIDASGLLEGLEFHPLDQQLALHEPCSLRNVQRAGQAAWRLLARIPDMRLIALAENPHCCGGAGGFMLREPGLASRLREPKIEHIRSLRPDVLVSANIGCALHISAGLREQRVELPVVHPVVILEQQLRDG